MQLLVTALITLVAGGIGALTASDRRSAGRAGWMSAVAACAMVLVATAQAFVARTATVPAAPARLAAGNAGYVFIAAIVFSAVPATLFVRGARDEFDKRGWFWFNLALAGSLLVVLAASIPLVALGCAAGVFGCVRRAPGDPRLGVARHVLLPLSLIYVVVRAIDAAGVPPAGVAPAFLVAAVAWAGTNRIPRDISPIFATRQVAGRVWSLCIAALAAMCAGIRAFHGTFAVLAATALMVLAFAGAITVTLLLLVRASVRSRTGRHPVEITGLYRRMPDTAFAAVVAGLSAASLPGMAVFAGVAFLVSAAASAIASETVRMLGIATIAATAICAVPTAVVLVRSARRTLFGIVSEPLAGVIDVGSGQRIPLHMLALLCAVCGIFPVLLLLAGARGAIDVTHGMLAPRTPALDMAFRIAWACSALGLVGASAAAVWLWRSARRQ